MVRMNPTKARTDSKRTEQTTDQSPVMKSKPAPTMDGNLRSPVPMRAMAMVVNHRATESALSTRTIGGVRANTTENELNPT